MSFLASTKIHTLSKQQSHIILWPYHFLKPHLSVLSYWGSGFSSWIWVGAQGEAFRLYHWRSWSILIINQYAVCGKCITTSQDPCPGNLVFTIICPAVCPGELIHIDCINELQCLWVWQIKGRYFSEIRVLENIEMRVVLGFLSLIPFLPNCHNLATSLYLYLLTVTPS